MEQSWSCGCEFDQFHHKLGAYSQTRPLKAWTKTAEHQNELARRHRHTATLHNSIFYSHLASNYPITPSPSRHAPAAPTQSPLGSAGREGLTRPLRRLALLVANRLIHTQDQARSLGRSRQGIDLDKGRLPHEALHHVRDALVLEVDAGPDLAPPVLDAEAVENIGGVEAGIVAQLPGNDLEGLGEALDDGLLLVRDVAVGEAV